MITQIVWITQIFSLILVMAGMPNLRLVLPAPQPEVEVVLSNIKSAKGVFVISFYNDDKSFPKPGHEAFTEKVIVKDTLVHTVKIKLPAEGWYAIAMFQDENETGKIKQDEIGIPLEAYGFSNNVHPKTSAPKFAACRFYVGAVTNAPVAIRLIQPKLFKKL
jgi:uncharacterized protein (DUF2141 family)